MIICGGCTEAFGRRLLERRIERFFFLFFVFFFFQKYPPFCDLYWLPPMYVLHNRELNTGNAVSQLHNQLDS